MCWQINLTQIEAFNVFFSNHYSVFSFPLKEEQADWAKLFHVRQAGLPGGW